MFLGACCNARHTSQSHHFSSFLPFDGFQLADWYACKKLTPPHPPRIRSRPSKGASIVSFNQERHGEKTRRKPKNNTILSKHRYVDLLGTIIAGPPCLAKCGRQFAVKLFHLTNQTWPLRTGLTSQTLISCEQGLSQVVCFLLLF